MLADHHESSPADEATRNMLTEGIERVLKTLSPRQRDIIERRFGLNGHTPATLEEIGKVLCVTRERIRQLEAKGLSKLREEGRADQLKGFIMRNGTHPADAPISSKNA